MPRVDRTNLGGTDADNRTPPTTDQFSPTDTAMESMARRIKELEEDRAAIEGRYIAHLEAENERLRSPDATFPATAAGEPQEPLSQPATPVYVASALSDIERSLAEMEMQTRLENWAAATRAKLAAANTACRVLTDICGDAAFLRDLQMLSQHAAKHGNQVPSTIEKNTTFDEFLAREVQLLRLAGLTEGLARQHVEQGATEYRNQRHAGEQEDTALERIQNPAMLLDALRELRDVTCTSADLLAMGVRNAQSRSRWRRIVTFGVGGSLIVASNALAIPLLGPAAAAVSGAIGSAAIGAGINEIAM